MTLEEWAEQLGRALGIDDVAPVAQILDLARDAAHAVTRPAAPLTTFLVGTAVGRGMPLADALAIVSGLLPEESAG